MLEILLQLNWDAIKWIAAILLKWWYNSHSITVQAFRELLTWIKNTHTHTQRTKAKADEYISKWSKCITSILLNSILSYSLRACADYRALASRMQLISIKSSMYYACTHCNPPSKFVDPRAQLEIQGNTAIAMRCTISQENFVLNMNFCPETNRQRKLFSEEWWQRRHLYNNELWIDMNRVTHFVWK